MPETEILTVYCDECGEPPRDKNGDVKEVKPTPKGNPRPPRGWRVVRERLLCPQCFKTKFRTLALSFPIAGTKETWDIVSTQWKETTALANWAMSELIANDIVRTPDMGKFPARPAIYLYGIAKEKYSRWSELPSSAKNSTLGQVEADWSSDRYAVLWQGSQSQRVYKYPQPYIMKDFNLGTVSYEGEERKAIIMRVGDARYPLVLSRDKGLRRQWDKLNEAAENGVLLEARLHRRKTSFGDHRGSVPSRTPGGGQKSANRIFATIVVLVPASDTDKNSGTIQVKTTPDSLIAAIDTAGDRVWWYNADHIRRIVIKHEKHLQRLHRLSEDKKHERRKPRHEGLSFREMVSDISRKDARRLAQAVDEVAASTVAFAVRRKYSGLQYDDACKEFCHNFRWPMLREKLRTKCHSAGIEFTHAPSPVKVEDEEE